MDNNPPDVAVLYYRVKQCDVNGSCRYTDVKMVKRESKSSIIRIYPQPVNAKLNVTYHSFNEGYGTVSITDMTGKTVLKETRELHKGTQSLMLNTGMLKSGIYLVTITDKYYQKTTQKFIKE